MDAPRFKKEQIDCAWIFLINSAEANFSFLPSHHTISLEKIELKELVINFFLLQIKCSVE